MDEPVTKRLKKNDDQPDLIICVKGEEIRFNKLILEEVSGLMRLRLLYLPAEQNKLQLKDEDPWLIRQVLRFLEGKYIVGDDGIKELKETSVPLEEVIQMSEAASLLDLAVRWEVPTLQKDAFLYMQRNLNTSSFYTISLLADKYGNTVLQAQCNEVLSANFCQLCAEREFVQLGKDRILSALRSPKFETSCWSTVFESIVSWVKHNSSRRQFFEELFSCIKLWNLPPDYLEKKVESNVLVQSNPSCLSRVQKAFREVYEKSEAVVMPSDPFYGLKIYFPLTKRSCDLEISCFGETSWISAVLLLQNHLYAFSFDQSVFRIDLSSQSGDWVRIAPTMYRFCEKFHATALNGNAFVFGRAEGNYNHCEKYEVSQNLWETLSVPKFETEQYSIASAGGLLYIIGVTPYRSEIMPSMEKYDPYDGSLGFASPMHTPIPYPSTAVFKEKIYAAGTLTGDMLYSVNIEHLDLVTGFWTMVLFSPSDGMRIIGAVSMECSVYFLGWLGNVPCPEKLHALSIPASCQHLKCVEVEQFDQFGCRFFTTLLPRHLTTYDVIIKVKNKEIPAHRKILSQVSDYFKAMFSHRMIENETSVVNIQGIDSCVVRMCIDFIYNAGCPSFTFENVELFLHAATYMQIPGLLLALTKFFKDCLSISTFKHAKTLSNKYGLFEVEDACDEYALKNFKEILESPFFPVMEKEYVEFLLSNRKDDVNDEMYAYISVSRWVKAGNGFRDLSFNDLFDMVNLVKLPENFVIENVAKDDLVNDSLSCLRKVVQSLAKRRELHEVICLIDFNVLWTDLKVFSPKLQQWKVVWSGKRKPNSLINCSRIASTKKHFYALGLNGNIYQLEYRNINARWNSIKECNRFFCHGASMVAANDFLFVIRVHVIEKYDINSDKWQLIDVEVDRDAAAAVAVEKRIYIVGGIDPSDGLSTWTLQCFDIENSTLVRNLPNMHQRRCNAAAAHFDGKLYVSGGCGGEEDDIEENLTSVECYDITSKFWTILTDMNFPRDDHHSCVVDGKLYVVGGDASSPETMEYLDDDQTWKIELMPGTGCGFATFGMIPYELFFHCEDETDQNDDDDMG